MRIDEPPYPPSRCMRFEEQGPELKLGAEKAKPFGLVQAWRGCALFLAFLFALFLVACSPAASGAKEIILATTTSTQDSGLLDVLIPAFQQQTGYNVKTIAVGTGQALKMGEQGNADVLLVHAPASEKQFMDAGYGTDRRLVMHNDFVIVGPPQDPAGVKSAQSPAEAFQKIAAMGAAFVSRGDDSGTHKMELSLWQAAGVKPEGAWYLQSGQGMGPTLKIASEKNAYTLTDRATYLALQPTLDLAILVGKDPSLLNVYHVILVNPARWPKVNVTGGRALADYLTSAEGQGMIAQFGVEKYGQPLFFADAGKTDAELGQK